MTPSDPHNAPASAETPGLGTAPELSKASDHPPVAAGSGREQTSRAPQAADPPAPFGGSLLSVRQRVAELRQTLISSGLGQPDENGAEALLGHLPELQAAAADLARLHAALTASKDASNTEGSREGGSPIPAPNADPQLLAPGSPEHQAALRLVADLQEEIARSQHLIQQGNQFWLGWARLLGLDTGYTPAGLASPISTGGSAVTPRISVEG